MAIGNNNNVCIDAFVEAMRTQLQATDPESADKVDHPQVRQNFEAFGEAVYRITRHAAETRSSAATDPAFWTWLEEQQQWLNAMHQWQQGIAAAFSALTPTTPNALTNLSAAVTALQSPPSPPLAPNQLTGELR